MILLDTDVVSEPLRTAPDPAVVAWLDAQPAESLFLSTISIGELLLGVAIMPQGRRRTYLRTALEDRIVRLFAGRIVDFDLAAAQRYAEVVATARRKGTPIGVADGQIAAIAAAHGFAVATRVEGPFHAAGVPVINTWAAG